MGWIFKIFIVQGLFRGMAWLFGEADDLLRPLLPDEFVLGFHAVWAAIYGFIWNPWVWAAVLPAAWIADWLILRRREWERQARADSPAAGGAVVEPDGLGADGSAT